MKIVVFDFDKTLIKDDSLTKLFIKLTLRKPFYFFLFVTLATLYKLRLSSNSSLKQCLFKLVIGDSTQLGFKVEKHIVFRHTLLLNILRFHLENGDLCIISSATIREVLEKYISDLNLYYPNLLLSSSLCYNTNNKIEFYNNYGINKVYNINKLGYSKIDIFFTDNTKADLPLISISTSVYKISKLRLTKVC